ncbi:MAG: sigma-70 family RNA polymerase sigma factor [Planctomycetaceae bacterium]|jgi:RNA polymerase sigma-70 factor, ECF subfamily|nr:sigma-70 family RNA polymerase sigma factor [Planctomycetaceae bacterium]
MNCEHRSDGSLMADYSQGNRDAAAELFNRYSVRLQSIARSRLSRYLSSRVDPEDIVQSAFKSFFRRAVAGGYVAPESNDLFNLLIVITMRKVNAHADRNLAAMRDIRRETAVESLTESAEGEPETLRDLLLTIEDVCCELTPTQRDIINLRLEGYTIAEIGVKAARSKRTVERELQNFRQRLAGYFSP